MRARALLVLPALALALTACEPAHDVADRSVTPASSSPRTIDLDLPAEPPLNGTDAGLITEPAPGVDAGGTHRPAAPLRPVERASAGPAAPAVVAPPAVEPVVQDPPPAVDVMVGGDEGFREDEEFYGDPDRDGVADQLPDERIGSYRCEDPTQVIVSVDPDVCGTP